IPRNINNICFNALSLGWVLKQKTIGKSVIQEVLDDLDLEQEGRHWKLPGFEPISWTVLKPKSSLQHALVSRSRIALFAMVLLPLLWMSGGPRRRVATGITLPAVSRSVLNDPGPPAVENATRPAATRTLEETTISPKTNDPTLLRKSGAAEQSA